MGAMSRTFGLLNICLMAIAIILGPLCHQFHQADRANLVEVCTQAGVKWLPIESDAVQKTERGLTDGYSDLCACCRHADKLPLPFQAQQTLFFIQLSEIDSDYFVEQLERPFHSIAPPPPARAPPRLI
jgi:hypothetical protein